jgi:hypothetical protein
MKVTVILNFPVLISQLPYMLFRPAPREWVPRQVLPEIWRALTWPLVGIFFWWLVGRGIDALRAARGAVLIPRIKTAETLCAVLLFVIGAIVLVGIITSTSDDRRDIQFLALVAGALLWGALASFTIAARFLQWRICKRSELAAAT